MKIKFLDEQTSTPLMLEKFEKKVNDLLAAGWKLRSAQPYIISVISKTDVFDKVFTFAILEFEAFRDAQVADSL